MGKENLVTRPLRTGDVRLDLLNDVPGNRLQIARSFFDKPSFVSEAKVLPEGVPIHPRRLRDRPDRIAILNPSQDIDNINHRILLSRHAASREQ